MGEVIDMTHHWRYREWAAPSPDELVVTGRERRERREKPRTEWREVPVTDSYEVDLSPLWGPTA